MKKLHSIPNVPQSPETISASTNAAHIGEKVVAAMSGVILGATALLGFAHTPYGEGTTVGQAVQSVENAVIDAAQNPSIDFRVVGTR
ncbi:MAG: hypothetical protein QG629_575 [Patescibacteria group bacterium]|nr:hypothetical protein [Patescibacteria group bacterium]